ncbi:MAG: type II toxin-antitoxin system RelE/ParE family toxin [Gemmataceae bacterium]
MSREEKPLVWLHAEIKTPPFSSEGRGEAGYLLGLLQGGTSLGTPHSRPMPSIGAGCHELRVRDETKNWRIFYRIDEDAIVTLEVFHKTTPKTPDRVIRRCVTRLAKYDEAVKQAEEGRG